MKAFADLLASLENSPTEQRTVQHLQRYLQQASPEDAAWAIYLLCGKKPKKIFSARELVEYFLQASGAPAWLFWESDDMVGDVNETIALLNDTLMREPANADRKPTSLDGPIDALEQLSQHSLSYWMDVKFQSLAELAPAQHASHLATWWNQLGYRENYILNRILTGTWKSSLPIKLIVQALSAISGVDQMTLMQRLKKDWLPSKAFYQQLIAEDLAGFHPEERFTFGQAHLLEEPTSEGLGPVEDWWLEWQWEGLRVQCIRRAEELFIWSQNGELVTERFPELQEIAMQLPEGTVLEGIIVACFGVEPLPLANLQARLGSKSVSQKQIETTPVAFVVCDLQMVAGEDVRSLAVLERKARLEQLVTSIGFPLLHFPRIEINHWQQAKQILEESRQRNAEGLVLKRLASPYPNQNQHADWWAWKAQPHTCNAILLYAKMEMGRAQKQMTEYTFAVWHEDQLMPVARTGIGLSSDDAELLESWIRANTVERFGPVRSVEPFHVYEIAFDGLSPSKRHKCGLVLRNPRILKPQPNMPIENANRLEELHQLMQPESRIQATKTQPVNATVPSVGRDASVAPAR